MALLDRFPESLDLKPMKTLDEDGNEANEELVIAKLSVSLSGTIELDDRHIEAEELKVAIEDLIENFGALNHATLKSIVVLTPIK